MAKVDPARRVLASQGQRTKTFFDRDLAAETCRMTTIYHSVTLVEGSMIHFRIWVRLRAMHWTSVERGRVVPSVLSFRRPDHAH